MSLFSLKICAEKGELGRNIRVTKLGEKKGVSLAAVLFFCTLGMQLARYEDDFFWKRTRLIYCPDERTSFSPRLHIPLMFHLDVLKSWLPRVTVGVPSVMTVVRLISCSRIRCISASTKLIDGRCSLIGLTHHDVKRSSSFMLSEVKPLAILLSAITEISLDSWKFCTCISIDAKWAGWYFCVYMMTMKWVKDLSRNGYAICKKGWTNIKQCCHYLPIEWCFDQIQLSVR